jgi:hypothetical protein
MRRQIAPTKQLKGLAQGPGPNARFLRWFFSTEVIERFSG